MGYYILLDISLVLLEEIMILYSHANMKFLMSCLYFSDQ